MGLFDNREKGPQNPDALPPVEFRQLNKSEKPVKQASQEISATKQWGDYTLVGVKNGDKLDIYDGGGKLVDKFPGNLKIKEFDFPNFLTKNNKNYLVNDMDHSRVNQNSYLNLSDIPFPSLQKLALKMMRKHFPNSNYASVSSIRPPENLVLDPEKNLEILEGGKYILIADPDSYTFLAFLTQSDKGVTLAPKDWSRILVGQPLPADLGPYVESSLDNSREIRPINKDYSAYVTDASINIVPTADLNSPPLFSQQISGADENFFQEAQNPNIIYYCAEANPKELSKLDISGDPKLWKTESITFPRRYLGGVRGLQSDPSGNFLLFNSGPDLIVVTKDTLEEVSRREGISNFNFDNHGRIHAIDKEGFLVTLEMDAARTLEGLGGKRAKKLAKEINVASVFGNTPVKQGPAVPEAIVRDFTPMRQDYEKQVQPMLNKVTSVAEAEEFQKSLAELRRQLVAKGLKPAEVDYVVGPLDEKITEKYKGLAGGEMALVLTKVEARVQGALSLSTVMEAKADLDQLAPMEVLMDDTLKRRYRVVTKALSDQSADLFRREGDKIIHDVEGLMTRVKSQLDQMVSKAEFDEWYEITFYQIKSRLGMWGKEAPLEAEEANKAILAAREELTKQAGIYKQKFEREYAKVREAAVARTDALIENLRADVNDLVVRLSVKGFKTRTEAEVYLTGSPAKKVLDDEIANLAGQNPDAAKELQRALKVQLSNTLSEIERGASTRIAAGGQQMVIFGKNEFPRWEAKVKEAGPRKVELIFEEDVKTHGPGVKGKDIFGDISVMVTDTHGKKEKVRLYENWDDENEWRLGLLHSKGLDIPPSYVTAGEYAAVKRDYAKWENTSLLSDYEAQRRKLRNFYKTRQAIGSRDAADETWKTKYTTLLEDYSKFCVKHNIALLRRIEQIKEEKETNGNGKGFVPSWSSHWVMDADTDKNLETMAKHFKMQLDLQEGMLNLKGHAGTGKDVLIKMFCNRTNRPYFALDGSKWTTEFELSEDVTLEAKDGGTQTIKVPSVILTGIQTPGAVVYFNEFNAMPEQAQIFLHSLLDEKRSITLKTSSGKVIKADKSVLLACSENPGYPGTFAPQFATKSRRVDMQIKYSGLTRENDSGDANPNKPFNASEPLRIARGLKSLEDLTYEPDLQRNDFVKLWDSYINGYKTGVPTPTLEQQFDLTTMSALIQYGNELRRNFILNFEQSKASRNAWPVSQPFTGRELRRMAYDLGELPATEKIDVSKGEVMARKLLETYYLPYLEKSEDRDKVRTELANFPIKLKRVGTP